MPPDGRGRGLAAILYAACAVLALLVSIAPPVRAQGPDPLAEYGEPAKARKETLAEAGAAVAVGSRMGSLPRIAFYRDLPKAWQWGAEAKMALRSAEAAYDYLPLLGVSLRKLWLGDGDTASIRNSEFIGFTLGTYFAYDFQGDRDGPRPMAAVSIGKYWMPFENRPLGLDLTLDLMTLKLPFLTSGHLSGQSDQVVVTFGLNLFYAFP